MPATNKVQTQLLLSPHIKTRAQALAVVRDEALAEIYRIALEGAGLHALEVAERYKLEELRLALEMMGMPFEKGVDEMLKASPRIRFAELFDQSSPEGAFRTHFPYRTS